ncbi:hypothetical protein, conserved, partial [Babesia bigemina]
MKNKCIASHSRNQDSATKKALEDIESKLKQVKNLQKNLEGLTDQNSCQKLLENLCAGLETFLGFNKDSKGYDGSGIVYSDLDRLCDGVMGFLSGVLGAVKNENEVITYDNNLQTKLKDVLDTLNTKIGHGRAGLAVSVAAVKGWLEGYEGEVGKKTKAVTDNITHLMNDLTRHKDNIDNEKMSDLSTQIQNWTARAEQYRLHVVAAEKDMKNLDSKLLGKLTPNIQMLFQAMETFKEAAKVEGMKEMYDLADAKMDYIKHYVTKQAGKRSEEIENYLKDRVGKLYIKLDNMKQNEFNMLLLSLDKDAAVAFNKVNYNMNSILNRYGKDIVKEVEGILAAAGRLKGEIQAEKEKLKMQVKQLGLRIEFFRGIFGGVKAEVVEDQSGIEHTLKLTDAIKGLTQQVVQNVQGYVSATLPSELQAALREMTDGIAKAEKSVAKEDGHLDKIANKAESYAKSFEGEAFGSIVEEWIYEILQNVMVKHWFDAYASNNNGRLTESYHSAVKTGLSSEQF